TSSNLLQQVINLIADRSHFDLWIHQSCRPHDLFDNVSSVAAQFIGSGCSRDKNGLGNSLFELLEIQRSIVKSGWKSKAIANKVELSRSIAFVHSSDLRYRDVTFVNEKQSIGRKIVHQGWRWFPGFPACKVARIVLDTAAITHRLNHLQVEHGSLMDPLGFHEPILLFESGSKHLQFSLDTFNGQ